MKWGYIKLPQKPLKNTTISARVPTIMENQMEKKMENEMETGVIGGIIRIRVS